MDALFEQHVAQNPGLTAFAILQAAIRLTEESKNERGLDLFAALLIPPLVFHRKTALALEGRQMTDGLFLRMIAEERELAAGLNERLIDLTPRTFRAIHLGCSTKLFRLVKTDKLEIFPLLRSLPGILHSNQVPQSVTTILAAAKRLGYCFATTELPTVTTLLRARL